MSTAIIRPTGPAEIPGHESTKALQLVSPHAVQVLIPEPSGLPPAIGEAYLRAMSAVQDLLESPDVQRRFAQVLLTQLRQRPTLLSCDPTSLVVSILEMAQHGLDPSVPNECYLVPYQGKVTMQVGYGGLMKLALAHPDVLDIWADEVCENDTYEYYGVNAQPKHVYPAKFAPRGRHIGYYAVALLAGDRVRAVQQSVDEIKDHAKRYSQNVEKQVWSEGRGGGFRGMARKTTLRMLCNSKYIPVAGKVADLFQQMDTIEGVMNAERADSAMEARQSLEAGKSLADHIEDLTGSRPGLQAARIAADYVPQIEALLAAQQRETATFWPWAERQKKKPQTQFTAADYADLLARLQRQAGKERGQAAQDATTALGTSTEASEMIEGNLEAHGYLPGEDANVDPETGEILDSQEGTVPVLVDVPF